MDDDDRSVEDDTRAEVTAALAVLAQHVDVLATHSRMSDTLIGLAGRCQQEAPETRHRLAMVAGREGRSPTPPPPQPPPPLAARAHDPAPRAADAPEWATPDCAASVYAARRADVQRVAHGGRAGEPVGSRAADDPPADGIDPALIYERRRLAVAAAGGR